MGAQLVSHLDLQDNYGALYWGNKRSLAILLADTLAELQLPAERVYTELALMQPAWLSLMVSHRLLCRQARSLEKVTSLGCLRPLLPGLATSSNMDLITTLDNYVHRLCGFQQVTLDPTVGTQLMVTASGPQHIPSQLALQPGPPRAAHGLPGPRPAGGERHQAPGRPQIRGCSLSGMD
jgi:hypothetical protein